MWLPLTTTGRVGERHHGWQVVAYEGGQSKLKPHRKEELSELEGRKESQAGIPDSLGQVA